MDRGCEALAPQSRLTKGRRRDIRFGDPADKLIEEATEGKYDLAVAGSRGFSASGGLLLGNMSRKLVKRMPCPVIEAGSEKGVRHEPGGDRQLSGLSAQPAARCPWRGTSQAVAPSLSLPSPACEADRVAREVLGG